MISEYPLVSIITPCYNSESYIERMLNSVLEQTYPNIELVCVDDGSIDQTVDVINSYKGKFDKKDYALICIMVKHAGQAAAVNAGLKVIHGDYLGFLDSDDFLISTSIKKRVEALRKNPDYAVVSSDYYIVNESDLNTVIGKGNDYIGDFAFQPNQFLLTIIGYSSISSMSYLIRISDLKRINSEMEIVECREGQNYQILLPLFYYYKRYYINEPLAYYVLRSESHAHSFHNRAQVVERNKNLLDMLTTILNSLGIDDLNVLKYKKMSMFTRLMEDT